jgi:hypothetical protein
VPIFGARPRLRASTGEGREPPHNESVPQILADPLPPTQHKASVRCRLMGSGRRAAGERRRTRRQARGATLAIHPVPAHGRRREHAVNTNVQRASCAGRHGSSRASMPGGKPFKPIKGAAREPPEEPKADGGLQKNTPRRQSKARRATRCRAHRYGLVASW